jgi:hypothetical protein
MNTKVNERFDAFTKGKDINESMDNLKQYYWEEEVKPQFEGTIDEVLQNESVDKEILSIMKELLNGVKVKKMSSYLEDMKDGKT